MTRSASSSPHGWLAFEDPSNQLRFYAAIGGESHCILSDDSGATNAFCQDNQGRIYYINNRSGLQVHHLKAGLIATLKTRKPFEPFCAPLSVDVEEDRLFVLDTDRIFVYKLVWEELEPDACNTVSSV